MANKKIIVLCGVSGAGKTYARENLPELACLLFVDIADMYRYLGTEDWRVATEGLIDKATELLETHDTIVVEGYFLPGSVSKRMLSRDIHRDIVLDFRLMVEPLNLCKARIKDSCVDVDLRIEILDRVWERSGKMLMDLRWRGHTWKPNFPDREAQSE